MSIHDNINKMKQEQRQQLADEEKGLSDFAGDISSALTNVFYDDSFTRKHDYLKEARGWIYGCVNAIAEEIASTEFLLKKFKGGDVSEIDDHPVLDLLYRANNVTTKFDLIKLTFQYLEQTGEAPWFLSFKNGKPVSIILLRPDRLTIKPGKDGELVGGYKYRIYGTGGYKEIDLEPQEVVPLRYTDPDSPLRGKGPLQAAQLTVEIDEYAELWNKKFFQNSATPGAALETDKILSKEVRDRLHRRIKEKHEGYDNAYKTMILEQGIKWKPLSISQKDMDFIAQQTFSRDKILAIFRVPRTVLGITDDVNRANAEATDYVFAKRTIKPKLEGFVQQLNEFLVPLFDNTGSLYLDYKDPVPENIELKLKMADGVQKGYMTINEARELLGLDPIDGGDELRDPLTFGPTFGTDQNALTAKKRKIIDITVSQKQSLMARARPIRMAEQMKKTIMKTVEGTITPIIYSVLKAKHDRKKQKEIKAKQLKVKGLWDGTPEEAKAKKVAFQVIQLRIGEEFEPKMIRALNTIFEKQIKRINTRLDAGDKTAELNLKNEIETYEEKLDPLIYEVIRKQSREAFRLVGQDNELVKDSSKAIRNRNVAQYLKDHIFELAKDLTIYTNELLGKTLSEGVQNEESIPQLKTRVSELFKNMEGYRSERIARTEVIRATNFATEEAYIESEVVEAKEWLTFIDERTDDDCTDLDGEVRKLGQSFENGVEYPPLHPNCRCTLIPVVI